MNFALPFWGQLYLCYVWLKAKLCYFCTSTMMHIQYGLTGMDLWHKYIFFVNENCGIFNFYKSVLCCDVIFKFQWVWHSRLLVRQQIRHFFGIQMALLSNDFNNNALDEQGIDIFVMDRTHLLVWYCRIYDKLSFFKVNREKLVPHKMAFCSSVWGIWIPDAKILATSEYLNFGCTVSSPWPWSVNYFFML